MFPIRSAFLAAGGAFGAVVATATGTTDSSIVWVAGTVIGLQTLLFRYVSEIRKDMAETNERLVRLEQKVEDLPCSDREPKERCR